MKVKIFSRDGNEVRILNKVYEINQDKPPYNVKYNTNGMDYTWYFHAGDYKVVVIDP